MKKKKTQKTISDKNYLSGMEEKTINKKFKRGNTIIQRIFFSISHLTIYDNYL